MQGDQSWKQKNHLRTYHHLFNNIIGCNNMVQDSMSKLDFKNNSKFHETLYVKKRNGE